MNKMTAMLVVGLLSLMLAGCSATSSNSSAEFGPSIEATASTGSLEISGIAFTVPVGYTFAQKDNGIEASKGSETLTVTFVSSSTGEIQMYEGDDGREWLQTLSNNYVTSSRKLFSNSEVGEAQLTPVNGINFMVTLGTAEKDGARSNLALACTYYKERKLFVRAYGQNAEDVMRAVIGSIV